jgi:hypothetical protein
MDPNITNKPYSQPLTDIGSISPREEKNKNDLSQSHTKTISNSQTIDSSALEKQASVQMQSQRISRSLLNATKAISSTQLVETKDGVAFHEAIDAAKNAGKQEDIDKKTFGTKESKWYGAFVNTYSATDYNKMTMLLLSDKTGGVAIKNNGDIVSVFKHPNCKEKLIDLAIPAGVLRGGTHLDCFAGALPQMYSKHGFIPVAKVAFNDTFKPEDWNTKRDGSPDIIFMSYNSEAAKTVDPDSNVRGPIIKQAIADLPYSSSYEEAEKTQILSIKK